MGKSCGALVQTIPCMGPPCPVDCKMSDWQNQGECSAQCPVQKQVSRVGAIWGRFLTTADMIQGAFSTIFRGKHNT